MCSPYQCVMSVDADGVRVPVQGTVQSSFCEYYPILLLVARLLYPAPGCSVDPGMLEVGCRVVCCVPLTQVWSSNYVTALLDMPSIGRDKQPVVRLHTSCSGAVYTVCTLVALSKAVELQALIYQ